MPYFFKSRMGGKKGCGFKKAVIIVDLFVFLDFGLTRKEIKKWKIICAIRM